LFIFFVILFEVALASLRSQLIHSRRNTRSRTNRYFNNCYTQNVAHIKETLFSVDPEVFLTVQATQQVNGATLAQNLK